MSKTKESAAERRAREAVEARAAQEAWEREKPARLLRALAVATDLDVEGRVYYRAEVLYYSFRFGSYFDDVMVDPVTELSEWVMRMIEQRLGECKAERMRQSHLALVRAQTLAQITDEQKEALGL